MFITFMEVFDDMCNLSDGVYLDGVEKGIIQGEARGIEKGIMQGKAEGIMQGKAEGIMQGAENKQIEMLRQFMSNNHTFEEFIQLFNITDKNEIAFLKDNIQVQ